MALTGFVNYTPGTDIAVVAPGCAVLVRGLPNDPLPLRLLDALCGGGVEEAVDVLFASGLRAAPDFAMCSLDSEGRARVLVRGAGSGLIDDGRAEHVVDTARLVADQEFSGATSVRITFGAATHIDPIEVPIMAGIVLCSAVAMKFGAAFEGSSTVDVSAGPHKPQRARTDDVGESAVLGDHTGLVDAEPEAVASVATEGLDPISASESSSGETASLETPRWKQDGQTDAIDTPTFADAPTLADSSRFSIWETDKGSSLGDDVEGGSAGAAPLSHQPESGEATPGHPENFATRDHFEPAAQAEWVQEPADAVDERGVGTLRLPDGKSVPVDRVIVLGRAPRVLEGHDPDSIYLARIVDPSHEVSSQHATVSAQGGKAWVTDLDSTNGTEVVDRTGARVRIAPNTPHAIESGFSIVLGEVATAFFETY